MPAPNELIVELRDIFADQFSLDELADFALELGVSLEDIVGTTRKAKARELATYLSRHDLVPQLAAVGPEARPDVDWAALLRRHGIDPAPQPDIDPPAESPYTVSHTDLQQLQPILAGRPMFMTPEGRATMLSLAGVGGLAGADLNGNSHVVAGAVLDQLNRYGAIEPHDTALGRLLAYVCTDPALPPDQKTHVEDVIARYGLVGQPE
jgi:hypothetical protein